MDRSPYETTECGEAAETVGNHIRSQYTWCYTTLDPHNVLCLGDDLDTEV
jgi:hypothetical protein